MRRFHGLLPRASRSYRWLRSIRADGRRRGDNTDSDERQHKAEAFDRADRLAIDRRREAAPRTGTTNSNVVNRPTSSYWTSQNQAALVNAVPTSARYRKTSTNGVVHRTDVLPSISAPRTSRGRLPFRSCKAVTASTIR
jgi:hypothetical protein